MTEQTLDRFTEQFMVKLREKGKLTADLVRAAEDLIELVEGIDGTMKHGTWCDEKGQRLKDTDPWVRLYVASRALRDLKDTPLRGEGL